MEIEYLPFYFITFPMNKKGSQTFSLAFKHFSLKLIDIHFLYRFFLTQAHERHQGTNIHYRLFSDANQPLLCVFGLGEETGLPRGDHANSVHTGKGVKQSPQPWKCEVNVLNTKPLCPSDLLILYNVVNTNAFCG